MSKRAQREQAVSGKFAHLHVHTEFSSLDGLGTIERYVDRMARLGQPAGAITDHGTVAGAPNFYHACRKAGIEPLLGEEFYVVPDVSWRPTRGEKEKREQYHLTVLARGEPGWRVLAELSTEANRHYYYKPIVDRAILESLGDDAKHLTVLSGCAGSMLSRAVLDEPDDAHEELQWWRETFPHFYIELMHHDTEFDVRLNRDLLRLARRYDVPWVVTNDPHYVDKEEAHFHDALLAIQTASDIDDPERFRFDGSGYHLRSRAEMRAKLRRYGDEVWRLGARNSLKIARESRTRVPEWEARSWQIPRFPDVEDEYRELRRLALRGLRERGLDASQECRDRLELELAVYKETGFSGFMLITRDFIQHARQALDDEGLPIPVGPGRGSVCGTFVGYLIGVHKMNSVKYNLMFERFLNPERPRQPDIDTDFGQARRGEMFSYAEEKYGVDNVVHVAAYQRMKVKGMFGSLAKAFGISYVDRMKLSKEIVEDEDDTGNGFILPDAITKSYPDLERLLVGLAGLKTGVSRHPAGVIIANPEAHLRKQVPQLWIASSKTWAGQFDLEAVEEMGLMKQDFLGLRTLDTVQKAVHWIGKMHGEELEPDEWVPDEEPRDKKVYRMLARGETAGVFQMEGPVNQRGCVAVQPECFEDLVSITSLYRTGPIQAKFPLRFIANRRRGEIEFAHPSLEPHLKDTWGVILYQEQVMSIAAECAGFDMLRVDDIKEAIKHKKSALMESMKGDFISGCKKTVRMPVAAAEELWGQIEGYSGYSYNRSHAVAYTFLTYQTARLKCLYPVEYIAALLATTPADKDHAEKRETYMREAVGRGIKILPPHVNRSSVRTMPTSNGRSIRMGFVELTGVGESAAQKIVAGRPPGGYEDLFEVHDAVKNTATVRALSESKTLEAIGVRGSSSRRDELLRWTVNDDMEAVRARYESTLDRPEPDPNEPEAEVPALLVGRVIKFDKAVTKNGKEYATVKVRWSLSEAWDIRLWSETKSKWSSFAVGDVISAYGKWQPRWMNLGVYRPSDLEVLQRAKTT